MVSCRRFAVQFRKTDHLMDDTMEVTKHVITTKSEQLARGVDDLRSMLHAERESSVSKKADIAGRFSDDMWKAVGSFYSKSNNRQNADDLRASARETTLDFIEEALDERDRTIGDLKRNKRLLSSAKHASWRSKLTLSGISLLGKGRGLEPLENVSLVKMVQSHFDGAAKGYAESKEILDTLVLKGLAGQVSCLQSHAREWMRSVANFTYWSRRLVNTAIKEEHNPNYAAADLARLRKLCRQPELPNDANLDKREAEKRFFLP